MVSCSGAGDKSGQTDAGYQPPALKTDKETLSDDLVDKSLAAFLADPTPANTNTSFAQSVRRELAAKNILPIADADFRKHPAAKVALGRALFNDRILSGNMTVSCASCHVPWRGTGDGTSLMNDIGFKGLFARIDRPKTEHVLPRNTPPLFNRGHKSFERLFWDGRVEPNPSMPSGMSTPAGADLPQGLDSPMAAQALFPLVSPEEMLGRPTDNSIAANNATRPQIWTALMKRVTKNNQYMQMLRDAYPGVADSAFGIQHVANALAAFQDQGFRADSSAFDSVLKGNDTAMTFTALQGAQIFYGRAQCSTCHTGSLQSDQSFHAIGTPQIGIGKGEGVNGREDFGRGGITSAAADRFKFKTPSLRNVFISGPWGHDGAFSNLREYVVHYGNPVQSFNNWNAGQVVLRANLWPAAFFDPFVNQQMRQNILIANEFPGVQLSSVDVDWIVEFMGTLTDRSYLNRDVVPETVPSGLNDFLGVFGLRSEWFNQLRPLPWL